MSKDIEDYFLMLENDMLWYGDKGRSWMLKSQRDNFTFTIRGGYLDMYEDEILICSYIPEEGVIERYFASPRKYMLDDRVADDMNRIIQILNSLDDSSFYSFSSRFFKAKA